MNKQKFVELLRTPEKISNSDLSELEALTKENPYFQSGHIVIARGSRLLKTPASAKKVNTAAIYATNRTILKNYMQGQVSGSVQPSAPKKVSSKPASVEKKPADLKQPVKPTSQPEKQPSSAPRKAPEQLSKSDHDLLIDDIYANLENWKRSRDHYLEFEKISDEPQLSTKDEDLEDAVEKIKNQIAEEVIAEDKVVNDQLEKIEASQSLEDVKEVIEEPSEKTEEVVDDSSEKVSNESEIVTEASDAVESIDSVEILEEVDNKIEDKVAAASVEVVTDGTPELTSDETTIEEEVIEEGGEPEGDAPVDLEEVEVEQIDSSIEQEDVTEEESTIDEISITDEPEEKTITEVDLSEIQETSVDEDIEEVDLSDDKVTSKIIDEELSQAESADEGIDILDIDEDGGHNPILKKMSGEDFLHSKKESLPKEKNVEEENSPEESEGNVDPETLDDIADTEGVPALTADDIDLSDDEVTSKIIDEEVNQDRADTTQEDTVDPDKKLDLINQERQDLHLEPKGSKQNKKFRLSILKKPIRKKRQLTTDPVKAKKAKKASPKKATEKVKPTASVTKTTKSPAKKTTVKKPLAEKAKKVSEKKTAAKTTKPKPEKKFKLGTSIAAKAAKKVTTKRSGTEKKVVAKKPKASTKGNKSKQTEIIDSFLEENPTIQIDKKALDIEATDLSGKSSNFPEEAATENLTLILENQGKFDLAISVYEKLKLKYPEKEGEFQDQIDRIQLDIDQGEKKNKNKDVLLSNFIEQNPTILVSNWEELIEIVEEFTKDMSSVSEELISESMAEVLLYQNRVSKAIEVYEKLISINPKNKKHFQSKIKMAEKK